MACMSVDYPAADGPVCAAGLREQSAVRHQIDGVGIHFGSGRYYRHYTAGGKSEPASVFLQYSGGLDLPGFYLCHFAGVFVRGQALQCRRQRGIALIYILRQYWPQSMGLGSAAQLSGAAIDRKSTRLYSIHYCAHLMPSSARNTKYTVI